MGERAWGAVGVVLGTVLAAGGAITWVTFDWATSRARNPSCRPLCPSPSFSGAVPGTDTEFSWQTALSVVGLSEPANVSQLKYLAWRDNDGAFHIQGRVSLPCKEADVFLQANDFRISGGPGLLVGPDSFLAAFEPGDTSRFGDWLVRPADSQVDHRLVEALRRPSSGGCDLVISDGT